MARRRRRVGGVAVSLAAAVSPWWHVRASVSGHCDPSSGEHRFAFDHGCSAPLSSYSARVELVGTLAQVMINETFTNEAQYPIEDASLALSVPGGATLLGFWAEISGSDAAAAQAMFGEVRMRQTVPSCPRTSWSGVSDSASAGNPGTLRLALGRIPPSASLNVRLEYVQEMKATPKLRQGAVTKLNLQLPSGARRKSTHRSGQERVSVLAVDVAVAAEKSETGSCSEEPGAAASGGSAEICRASTSSAAPRLVDIASPSHGTGLRTVDAGADQAGAAQLRSDILQDVVLEIRFAVATDAKPELFLEQHPSLGTAVAALWLPPSIVAASHSNFEVVLILDRSPSMLGTRLDRIRQAAKTFIRSVPVGASLNLVGFGASEVPLFKESSQKLSTDTFKAAGDYINAAFDSRMGERGVPGAQGALAAVLKDLKRDDATQLCILFLTDRHVPDGDACLRDIAAHCAVGSCQLSTLGLGWGASPQFVENAAKAGRGTARFVAERGGVEPLERTLVMQLAEALQPAVKDVDVAWADALAAESLDGVVSLLSRPPSHEDDDLQRFDKQGGVRELTTVPVDLPAVAAGDRLLAAAFLGRVSEDLVEQLSVVVHATIGGVRTSSKARVSHVRRGNALHTFCAGRLVEALEQGNVDGRAELAGAEDRDWQVQALGLIYQLTTAHTQWLAIPGAVANLVAVGGQSLMMERSDSVHCTGPRGMSAAKPFSAYSPGYAGGASNWDLDPSAGLGRSQAQAPGAELSVRRPGGSPRAASLSIQAFGRLMPRLSTLDFTEIGSSVSLRSLSTGNNPLGPDMYGADYGRYGADYGRYKDPWSQSYHGSSMAVRPFDRFAGKDALKQAKLDESLSLRSLQKCGSKLSVLSTSRLSKQLSAVDFTALGSSLALRKLFQPPGISPYRFSTLSMLDYSCMSSSLSLGGWGFGRRSLSVQGSSRFHDYLSYGLDGGPGDLPELRGANPSSLSLRSFKSMGKPLAVLGSAEGAARQAKLASELVSAGAADVSSLGSALALRPLGNPFSGKGAGRRGQPPDLEHLASSLSLRRLSTGSHPLGYGDFDAPYGGLNDLLGIESGGSGALGSLDGRKKKSEGSLAAEISPQWDEYPPRYGSLGYPSTRQVGRLGSKLSVVGDAKTAGASTEKQSRPDAWVGVGSAGGLVVPVLPIWRTGSTCQAGSEEVRIDWPASTDAARRLGAAVVYAASGPAVGNGAVRLSEMTVPMEEAAARANIAFQLSQSCVLTARTSPSGKGSAELLKVSLAKTTLPVSAATAGETLAAALKKKQSASSTSADPVTIEALSPRASTGSSARSVDYHTLIDLQLFDGSFDFSKMSTDAITGLGLEQPLLSLLVAAYSSGSGGGNGALVAHTATALALLRTRHMAAEDAWALVAAKAEAWLAGAGGGGELDTELAPPRCFGDPELCIAAADLIVVQWARSPPRSSR